MTKEVAEIRHQARMGNHFAFKNYSNWFPQFPDAYQSVVSRRGDATQWQTCPCTDFFTGIKKSESIKIS